MSCRIYQSPGRIRVRLNTLKSAIPCELLAELRRLHGVRHVLSSELTGSIVIYYDRNIRCSSSLIRIFRRYGMLENVIGFPMRNPLVNLPKPKTASIFEVVNDFLRKAIKASLLA